MFLHSFRLVYILERYKLPSKAGMEPWTSKHFMQSGSTRWTLLRVRDGFSVQSIRRKNSLLVLQPKTYRALSPAAHTPAFYA